MSEKRLPKPGEVADDEALSGSDEAQAHVRRWWRLVPRILTRPTEVFVALRDDEDVDVDARSEPILAIVIVAGMAGILLTPAWATLIDDGVARLDRDRRRSPSSAGCSTERRATSCSASSCGWARVRSVSRLASRTARQVVGFAALPFALSFVVTVPAVLVAFGYDWFHTGGSDDGTGRVVVLSIATRARALVARVAGARPADDLRAAVAGRRRRVGARRGDHRGVRRAAVVVLTASASQRAHAVPGIR